MKIIPTGSPASTTAPARRPSRDEAGAAAFGRALPRAGAAAAPAGPGPPAPLASPDAVLALQEVAEAEDATERRRRAMRRGYDLLDELEAIREGLLEGRLPRAVLRRLGVLVAEKRGRTEDARLEALLDEIEVRAAVELAKLERAQG